MIIGVFEDFSISELAVDLIDMSMLCRNIDDEIAGEVFRWMFSVFSFCTLEVSDDNADSIDGISVLTRTSFDAATTLENIIYEDANFSNQFCDERAIFSNVIADDAVVVHVYLDAVVVDVP